MQITKFCLLLQNQQLCRYCVELKYIPNWKKWSVKEETIIELFLPHPLVYRNHFFDYFLTYLEIYFGEFFLLIFFLCLLKFTFFEAFVVVNSGKFQWVHRKLYQYRHQNWCYYLLESTYQRKKSSFFSI